MRGPIGVPTIQREDVDSKNGGHGAKSAFAYAACRNYEAEPSFL
jgi:hypothetical protein